MSVSNMWSVFFLPIFIVGHSCSSCKMFATPFCSMRLLNFSFFDELHTVFDRQSVDFHSGHPCVKYLNVLHNCKLWRNQQNGVTLVLHFWCRSQDRSKWWPTHIVAYSNCLFLWLTRSLILQAIFIKKNIFVVPFCLFDLLNIHIKLWKWNDFRRVCLILNLNENRKSQPRNRKICLQVLLQGTMDSHAFAWLMNKKGESDWWMEQENATGLKAKTGKKRWLSIKKH